MNDDYIFDEEIDEEAAKEKAAREANQNQYQSNNRDESFYRQGQDFRNADFYQQNQSQQNFWQENQYQQAWNQQTNTFYARKKTGHGPAIWAMVLGAFSMVFFLLGFNIITAIIAIICGIAYLRKYEPDGCRGMAIAGIVTAVMAFVLTFWAYGILMSNDSLGADLYNELYGNSSEGYYFEYDLDEDELLDQFNNSNGNDFLDYGSDNTL